jgi:hypothetical protein
LHRRYAPSAQTAGCYISISIRIRIGVSIRVGISVGICVGIGICIGICVGICVGISISIRIGIRICVRVIIIITARRCSDRGTYGAQTSKAQQNWAQTTTVATGKLINRLYLGKSEIS